PPCSLLLGRAAFAGPLRGATGARVGAPLPRSAVHSRPVGSSRYGRSPSSARLGARARARGLSGPAAFGDLRSGTPGDGRSNPFELSPARRTSRAALFRLLRLRAALASTQLPKRGTAPRA